MVGSPYQTAENLADDLMFLQKLRPQMIGIGPFIPHHDTPFKDEPAGSVELTLVSACRSAAFISARASSGNNGTWHSGPGRQAFGN